MWLQVYWRLLTCAFWLVGNGWECNERCHVVSQVFRSASRVVRKFMARGTELIGKVKLHAIPTEFSPTSNQNLGQCAVRERDHGEDMNPVLAAEARMETSFQRAVKTLTLSIYTGLRLADSNVSQLKMMEHVSPLMAEENVAQVCKNLVRHAVTRHLI